MTRIIAVAVPKGGTGKTTTVFNLGAALAEQGQRVLLVDFDPQGNLTQAAGLRPNDVQETSYTAITHFLTTFTPRLEDAIYDISGDLHLVPTSARLNRANDELAMALERERVLSKLLAPVAPAYDFILIDTLPYQGILTLNALVAAGEVVIPLQAEYLASESVQLILEQVAQLRRQGINPALSITGILLTMVDARTNLHREAVQYAREVLGQQVPVFQTLVKREIAFPESQARHESILAYAPQSGGATAYRALAEEVLHAQR
jgi:chromosome partitioning protein